jgi:hypothetical protein
VYLLWRGKSGEQKIYSGPDFMRYVFIAFIILFCIGHANGRTAMLLVNLMLFVLGIHYIRKGSQVDHLGILNYGLLILAAVITCRYFDSDMSFLVRGITFVLVGAGFFAANYMQLKKRRESKTATEE